MTVETSPYLKNLQTLLGSYALPIVDFLLTSPFRAAESIYLLKSSCIRSIRERKEMLHSAATVNSALTDKTVKFQN
jgi:hypothetical protein